MTGPPHDNDKWFHRAYCSDNGVSWLLLFLATSRPVGLAPIPRISPRIIRRLRDAGRLLRHRTRYLTTSWRASGTKLARKGPMRQGIDWALSVPPMLNPKANPGFALPACIEPLWIHLRTRGRHDKATSGGYHETGRTRRSSCQEIVSPQQELSAAAKGSG